MVVTCILVYEIKVNDSNYGREHIVPSIVHFAFLLLESVEEENFKEICHSNGLLGMEDLAFQMLKTLFEVHDMARNEVGAIIWPYIIQ